MSKKEISHSHSTLDGTNRTIVDGGDPTTSPSTRVVYGVADTLEADPMALRPLYEVIDPDALDELVATSRNDTERCPTPTVCFRYEGCIVRFDADGTLSIDVAE